MNTMTISIAATARIQRRTAKVPRMQGTVMQVTTTQG